jgi:hypothetical protein
VSNGLPLRAGCHINDEPLRACLCGTVIKIAALLLSGQHACERQSTCAPGLAGPSSANTSPCCSCTQLPLHDIAAAQSKPCLRGRPVGGGPWVMLAGCCQHASPPCPHPTRPELPTATSCLCLLLASPSRAATACCCRHHSLILRMAQAAVL